MVEVSNNFIQECEANVGTYKFGKIKVNYIDDNPFNYEQGAYSSSNGAKIDAEQSIRYNKLVECEPNFKYKIELGNSHYKMKIVTYNANQAFIAAHDNLAEGSELTTEGTAAYISVTIYSNDTLEGTNITLNNTIRNGEIAGAELQGNTTQKGTPTPDAPVEVNNVTGEQVVRVCGKNILPQDKYKNNTTINGITYTNNRDGTFNISGTATADTSIAIIPSGNIELEASQPYYFYSSVPYDLKTFNLTIAMTDNGTTKFLLANNTYTPTTTLTNVRLQFYIASGRSIDQTNIKLMLVKGSTRPTEYEKYQGKDYEINLTSRNLLDLNLDKVVNQNGITYSVESDGTITINGTATAQTDISYLNNQLKSVANKKYSLNFIYISGTLNGTMNIFNQDGNNGWKGFNIDLNGTGALSNKSAVGSYPIDLDMKGARFIRVKKDAVVDNLKFKLTFVQSDVADYNYAPYFTPIELNKIGNYQDFIKKGTGKNLFNKDTITTGKYITNSGGEGTNGGTFYSDFIKVQPSTKYYVSGRNNGWENEAFYDKNKTFISRPNEVNNIFTTTSTTYYIRVNGHLNDLNNLQIEKGTTATYYEPYGYKDKWYIEKNVGKVVFNGSENGGSMIDNNQRILFNSYNIPILSNVYIANPSSVSNLTPSLCNHFLPSFQGDLKPSNTKFAFSKWADTIYIYFSAIVDNVADFKTWLGTHNTSVYYALNTPEYTLIENEELLNQLEAVSHAQTQEGTSNILVSGNLPATLKVTPDLTESIRGKQTTPIVGYNITGDDDLINFKITSKADSNGNILGATSQSQVDIEIFNENNTHNLENKQVYISTGLAETEGNYCKWQPFTITQTKDTQTKNHTTYTGYDDMMRGNEAYIDNVDYGEEGVTLYDFTCKLAKEMGMALENTTMTNGDFIVKGNNFTNNEAKLVVLKNVAQMVGGFAMIDRGNFLRIVELSPEDAMTPIELTTNLYTEDFQNSAKFGEINEFAIGETNIETNAIVRSDDASIAKNGVKKIEILDNMFLGLLEDKETAIEPLWDAFNGFSYYPFKTPYNGYPYIDLGDKINITDINSNIYGTLVLNNVFEYNGGYKGNIGAEALSITAAKYKTNNTLGKQFRKVGIEIDRVEGKITSEIAAATDGITNAYNTAISQTEKKINLSVTEINKVLSGDPKVEGDTGLEGTVNKINQTYLTVDSNDFTVVSSTATEAKKKADAVEENTQKIVSQLHFDAETGLTISAEGSADDDMKLNLTNSQVNFMYRNSPVLIINGNKIEFTGATFQKFDLGSYVWQAEDDDSLSLIYEGD